MKLPFLTLLLCLFSSESMAQLLNGGFENLNSNGTAQFWTAKTYSFNVQIDSNGQTISDSVVFDKTNYAITNTPFTGNFALELRNGFNFTTNKALPGIAFSSSDSNNYGGFGSRMIEVNSTPDYLSFYGNFKSVGNDTAYALIKVFNSSLDEIGSGMLLITSTSNNFAQFNVPVNYLSTDDAAFVSIEFGTAQPEASAHLGSVFKIDDVQLTYSTEMDMVGSGELITFFSNPASSSFRVNTKKVPMGKGLILVDMSGKAVHIFADTEGVYLVDNFREGIYVVIVPGLSTNFRYKLVVRR